MRKNILKYLSIFISIFIIFSFYGCNETTIDKENSQKTETRIISAKVEDNFSTSAECDVKNGYVWQVSKNSDSTIVSFIGSKFVAKDPTIVGSVGIQDLQFKALKKGTAKVVLEYYKVGDATPKVEKTIVLNITVR